MGVVRLFSEVLGQEVEVPEAGIDIFTTWYIILV